MDQEIRLLAFDLGASSGRAMLGRFDGQTIRLEELHRFSNDPVMLGETLYWDLPRLVHEIKQGLLLAKPHAPISSMAIDTWGVDFGLIDEHGYLLDQPVHYRDRRTETVMPDVFAVISGDELYRHTGIQLMNINTIFQLAALRRDRPDLLERADQLLLMPDLLLYLLTGIRQSEYTMASTTQLLDANQRDWDWNLIDRLGLRARLFAPIRHPGVAAGTLSPAICAELGIDAITVMTGASHDTAAAVVSIPATTSDFIYISSGTWSLMGIETEAPVINDQTRQYNFTNEGGFARTTRLLKNIMGLWLIQESRRQWIRDGAEVSYADIEREALASPPFRSLIDPDDASLAAPGDMPERIRTLCRDSGQPVPRSRGEVARCIYESLALKYRITLEQIEQISGKSYRQLHIVGGGTRDGLLSQFTANATACAVIAGPAEATALGNMAVQLMAGGHLKDLKAARAVAAASCELKTYQPQEQPAWRSALDSYRQRYGGICATI
ncbi:MAG: rhamnulokinase [Eubacteriales bacterium]|nr:rhamnulokinase [Eubacteriales bacterium]